MNRLLRYLFYGVMGIYTLYNFMWIVGITFSYSKNDSPKELIYIFLTFLLDIPIIWYLSKNLKIGLFLLASAIVIGVIDGLIQWELGGVGIEILTLWYGPKLIPIVIAILVNRSDETKNKNEILKIQGGIPPLPS